VEKSLFFLSSFRYDVAIPFDPQASLSFKEKKRLFLFRSFRCDLGLVVRVPLELGSRAAGWAIAFGASFFAAL